MMRHHTIKTCSVIVLLEKTLTPFKYKSTSRISRNQAFIVLTRFFKKIVLTLLSLNTFAIKIYNVIKVSTCNQGFYKLSMESISYFGLTRTSL
jgi:hypothetical protein